MNIYEITPDTSFLGLCWDETANQLTMKEFDFIKQFFSGTAFADRSPPALRPFTFKEVLQQEESKKAAREMFERGFGNCPFYSAAALVFDQVAKDGLADLLASNGELLPTQTDSSGRIWYLYNCTNVIDAIDRDRCDIEYYDHGMPRMVRKYVFNTVAIGESAVFRLAMAKNLHCFCHPSICRSHHAVDP